jgi:membrane-bound lytic murein transglycosylase B
MVLAFDRTEQRSAQQDRPTPYPRAQRPVPAQAAPPRPPRRVRRRRRWPVALVATAALAAVFAPPPGHHLTPVAQLNDASLPWDVAARQQIQQLSAGAPAGALTLTAMPVQVARTQPAGPPEITGLAANGIPNVALNAYRVAAARMANADPGCGIDWSLLAGIGRVESNHGRFGGASLNPDGSTTPKIIGPPLDGGQFAYIGDTDGGTWDGDSRYDRAVGPMQFIPSTWRAYAVDGDGNGTTDPTNINDAALGAAHYLCVAGGDLRTSAGQHRAVMAYNHSDSYVAEVLALAAAYAAGIPVADLPPLVGNTSGGIPAPSGYWAAPAAPGPAMGARDTTTSSGNTTYSRNIAPATAAGGSSPNGAAAAPAAGGGSPSASGGSAGSAAGGSGGGGGSTPAGGSSGSSGGNAAPAPAPAPAPAAPAPSNPLPSGPVPPVQLPSNPLPVEPPPVQVPETPVVPQVTSAAGQLVDAIPGVTCDDLALTPLPVCPAGV